MILMEFPAIPRMVSADEFEAEVAPLLVAPFKSKFRALLLDDLDVKSGAEHEWLIDDILSIADISITGGPSQSGKSFLAIHAAMCIATGTEFFGHGVKKGLVVYQAGEGARGVKKRLRAWRKHHNLGYDARTPFVLLQSPVDLYRPEGDVSDLIAEINGISALFPEHELLAVFIDTLATAAVGAEENSAKDMGMVMSNIKRIREETGAHASLVHHMNAGGDKLRGSTAIYANIDQSVFVKNNLETKVRTLSLGKQRDDEDTLKIQFELARIEVGWDEKNDKAVTSCVCVPLGEKEAIRREEEQKGWRLNDAEIVFMKALFEADRKYGQPVPSKMNLPTMVRSIVPYEHVKAAYVELSPNDQVANEGDDAELVTKRYREALKKRLQRTREALTRFGVINAGDGFVWWTGKALRAFPHTKAAPVEETPTMVDGEEAPPF